MEEHIKTHLEALADDILEKEQTQISYSDKDFVNAMLIFSEVIMSKTFDYHRRNVNDEGMKKVAKLLGDSMRNFMLIFTGIDMHEAVKGKKTHLS